MEQFKILFLGPVNSGKTTAVKTLCGDSFISTEEKTTDNVVLLKNNTTVAMDYGVFPFGENKKLHVYGAPGQVRFQFMIDILLTGCLGTAILINTKLISLNELKGTLTQYYQFVDNIPIMIALTHVEDLTSDEINAYIKMIQDYGIEYGSITTLDPRNKKDVALLVEKLIMKIHRG